MGVAILMTPDRLQELKSFLEAEKQEECSEWEWKSVHQTLELITALEKAWAETKRLQSLIDRNCFPVFDLDIEVPNGPGDFKMKEGWRKAMDAEMAAAEKSIIRNIQAGHVWTHELSKEYDPAEIIPFDKDFKS